MIEKEVSIKQLEAELEGCKQQLEELVEKRDPSADVNEADLVAPSSPIQAMKKLQEQLQHENENGSSGHRASSDKLVDERISELEKRDKALTLRNAELEDLLKSKDEEMSQLQQDITGLKTLLHDLEKGITSPDDLQVVDH